MPFRGPGSRASKPFMTFLVLMLLAAFITVRLISATFYAEQIPTATTANFEWGRQEAIHSVGETEFEFEMRKLHEETAVRENSRFVYQQAYLDFRFENASYLRVMALQVCNNSEPIYAWFFFRSNSSEAETVPIVKPVTPIHINSRCPRPHWNRACYLNPFYLQSELPEQLDEPTRASTLDQIVLSNSNSSLGNGSIINELISFREFTVIPRKQNYQNRLAVCVLPLYLFSDWSTIVQFIEIWREMGAETFTFYESSITADVDRWLDAYRDEGIVERVVWPPLPRFPKHDPNLHMYRLGYNLATLDCIQRHSGKSQYLALVDVDEYLMPLGGAKLSEYINLLDAYTTAGAFMVPHQLLGSKESTPDKIDFQSFKFDFFEKIQTYTPGKGPGKILVRPDRTLVATIHKVREVLPGFEIVHVTDARLYHLRRRAFTRAENDKISQCHLFTPFQSNVTGRLQYMTAKYFPDLSAMDSGMAVSDRMHHCLDEGAEATRNRTVAGVCRKVPHHACRKELSRPDTKWVMFGGQNDIPNKFSVLY